MHLPGRSLVITPLQIRNAIAVSCCVYSGVEARVAEHRPRPLSVGIEPYEALAADLTAVLIR
jgi:hypothetical protein